MTEPPGPEDSLLPLLRLLAIVGVTRLVALAALATLFWNEGWVSHLVQDMRTWHEFFLKAQAGQVPYVHFTKEYPVLGGALYWLMSPFVDPGDLRQTVVVHGLFMLAADLVNVVLFHRAARGISPRHAFVATLAFALNLTTLVVAPVRYESFVVLFVLLGWLAHRRGAPLLAAAWWAIGCGLKWYPAFFLLAQEWRIFVVERRRWHWIRVAAVFAAVFVGINLPFLLGALGNGTLSHWSDPYLFHARRPLYWDTLLGVGQIWLGALPWEQYAGAWSLVLMLAAVAVRPAMPLAQKGVLVLLAAVVFNRIYSTQFNLWFYPLLILAILGEEGARRRLLIALAVALDVLNVLVFPTTFTPAVAEMGGFFPFAARDGGGPATVAFSAVIVVRAMVVVALAACLLRRPAR